jgi:hypothetical protein
MGKKFFIDFPHFLFAAENNPDLTYLLTLPLTKEINERL